MKIYKNESYSPEERAKKLLSYMTLDEKIDEIAHFAGFCSRTHFCTAFKKRHGISPKEFRSRNKT